MRRTTVLLATSQGAQYLPVQLDSLVRQEGMARRILASDDGSTVGTQAILEDFAARHGLLAAQHEGPRRRLAANFLHLLALAESDNGLLPFCGQDDVWRPGKITRAGAMLEEAVGPALWIGRVNVCDGARSRCRPAPVARDPSFGHGRLHSELSRVLEEAQLGLTPSHHLVFLTEEDRKAFRPPPVAAPGPCPRQRLRPRRAPADRDAYARCPSEGPPPRRPELRVPGAPPRPRPSRRRCSGPTLARCSGG